MMRFRLEVLVPGKTEAASMQTLRRVLKRLLRGYGVRCTGIRPTPTNEDACTGASRRNDP